MCWLVVTCIIVMLQLLGVGRAYQYFFLLFPHLIPQDDNRLLWYVYGFGGGQIIPILIFHAQHNPVLSYWSVFELNHLVSWIMNYVL